MWIPLVRSAIELAVKSSSSYAFIAAELNVPAMAGPSASGMVRPRFLNLSRSGILSLHFGVTVPLNNFGLLLVQPS